MAADGSLLLDHHRDTSKVIIKVGRDMVGRGRKGRRSSRALGMLEGRIYSCGACLVGFLAL